MGRSMGASVLHTKYFRSVAGAHMSTRYHSTKATEASTSSTFRPYIDNNTSTTHFGYREVPITEKEQHVKHVFENVADSYDVMNDLMSGGLHRAWKDYLLQISSVETIASAVRRLQSQNDQSTTTEITPDGEEPTFQILDVAGGTGDIAFRF